MRATSRTPWTVRTGLTAVAAVSILGLGACSDTEPLEEGVDPADPADDGLDAQPGGPLSGVDNPAFFQDLESYVGEEVEISAEVTEVISPTAFTIAGAGDTGVGSLLVVSATELAALEPDARVGVTGTVRESFAVAEVEEELGIDLEDELFADWDRSNYLVADDVEVLEATG